MEELEFSRSLELHKYLHSIYMAKHSAAAAADSMAPFVRVKE